MSEYLWSLQIIYLDNLCRYLTCCVFKLSLLVFYHFLFSLFAVLKMGIKMYVNWGESDKLWELHVTEKWWQTAIIFCSYTI